MKTSLLRFFILFFSLFAIINYTRSQIQQNEFETKKLIFPFQKENPKETIDRLHLFNLKNNNSVSEKKVLYLISYGFFNYDINDTLYGIENKGGWYEFDKYLNTKRIVFNESETHYLSYNYDLNNRLSSKLEYSDYWDEIDIEQKIYKYDNYGRVSEIQSIQQYKDNNNPENNRNYKSKGSYTYEGDNLEKTSFFLFDFTSSVWNNTGQITFEKTNNSEIERNYYFLNNELTLMSYDSTYFNNSLKPEYRLIKQYSFDSLKLLDAAIFHYEYLNDTLIIKTEQNFYKIYFYDSDFDTNMKLYSEYFYNNENKVIKYQKYNFNFNKMEYELLNKDSIAYDNFGNITYVESNCIYNDTLMNYTFINKLTYNYSDFHDNIYNDVTPFFSEHNPTSIESDYRVHSNMYLKHFDQSFFKPNNVVSQVYFYKKYLQEDYNNNFTYYYSRYIDFYHYRNQNIESFEKPQISIIPNPTADNFRFYIAELFDSALIQIFDITGKLVLEKNTQDNCIDVSYLRSGLYILIVKTNENIWSEKFIKN